MTNIPEILKEYDETFARGIVRAGNATPAAEYVSAAVRDFLKEKLEALLGGIVTELKAIPHPCLNDPEYPHDDCASGIRFLEGVKVAIAIVESKK